METYTTVQGDMWDSIAHNVMGDVSHTNKLINCNQQYREYYTFPAGIVLQIPEVKETTVKTKLPPWKQVSG